LTLVNRACQTSAAWLPLKPDGIIHPSLCLVLIVGVLVESLLAGAERATGSVAVIDVLRAFTTAAVALANGASQIVMVGTVEEALALRTGGAAHVCMGEVRGRKPDEFDLGNSPFELLSVCLAGATIAQRTSAGTQGVIAAAHRANRLYAVSLVTASATARALRSEPADRITLVAMGHDGTVRTDEDELCALHLRNLLEGRPGDPEAVRRLILAGGEAERFRDPTRSHLIPGDLEVALDIDRYGFAVRVSLEAGHPVARMERAN
jgi:2-phosphosulfolactate phosphatase